MSNLVEHATRELALCGQTEDPEYAASIVKAVEAFASYGHSGGSHGIAVEQLGRLLRFQALSPITSNPDEWFAHGAVGVDGGSLWQNRRQPSVFSTDGGATWYDVDALAPDADQAVAIAREVDEMAPEGGWWHAHTPETLTAVLGELVASGVPLDKAGDLVATVKGVIADEYGN